MSKKRPLIMLTRPQAQSERFAQMCREALGADQQIILSPLLNIEVLPFEVPDTRYRGLIFTSENGVRAYAHLSGYQDLPAYCVGERTAKAANEVGLTALSANGSADDLVTMIKVVDAAGPMLHIRGEHTRGDIANRIGVQVDEIVAYRQTAQPLNEEAQSALLGRREVILPLFSPRTAQIFFAKADPVLAPLKVIAISEAVNETVLGSNPPENMLIRTSDRPDALAMVQAIKNSIETF